MIIVVTAVNRDQANSVLEQQGYGPNNFNIEIIPDTFKDIASDTEQVITHYGCSIHLKPGDLRALRNLLATYTPEEDTRTFAEYLQAKAAKRGTDRYDFGAVFLIRPANRAAVINRLVGRYPDANTRFFLTGLSQTGILPIQAYSDWFKLDRSYGDEVQYFADNLPQSEIWLWPARGEHYQIIKDRFDIPKYKDPNRLTRTAAFVRVLQQRPTVQEVLTATGLQIIP